MIKITDLNHSFGDRTVLNHISLFVKKGEAAVLLGPNGAGKTTLMNILSGALVSESGTVEIDGRSMAEERALCQSLIGYAPESPPLYGQMTVSEYLNFSAGLKRIEKKDREEAVGRISEMFDLEDVFSRRIENLSRGYRQRISLAQAFLGDPAVILLDEPTSGLDPGQIKDVRDIIFSVKEQKTVLFSTHILQEASALCDRFFILDRGRIQSFDSMIPDLEDIFLKITGKK